MFDSLTDNLTDAFDEFRGKGKLSEAQVESGLKEVRRVLLAADVHYSVVKKFINDLRERATNEEIMDSLSPAQQLIQLVQEDLEELLGGEEAHLEIGEANQTPVLLVGLQGTGKTTSCAKLAHHYTSEGNEPLLISTDDQRPAAQDQLKQLADENGFDMYTHDMENVDQHLKNAREQARENGQNPLIIDTAGRLSIDEPMIDEVQHYTDLLPETKVLLVLDGMMGQEALQIAEDFNEALPLDGLIMTKMEGDARGGAAISAKEVTGVPIMFLGVGEKVSAITPFYPERMASRILGMGDMLSLIEEAEEAADLEEQKEMQERMLEGKVTMEDVEKQLKQLKNMGPIEGILEKLPGGFELKKKLDQVDFSPKDIDRMQAIIRSMTQDEKNHPDIIDGSRRRRIAKGSGTSVEMVNQLLEQYQMMKKMMKKMKDNQGMMQEMASGMGFGDMGNMMNMFGN
ncbi:MAG: signal recognition particle protein [bacterium]